MPASISDKHTAYFMNRKEYRRVLPFIKSGLENNEFVI
jgi:hypothetical protein